MTEGDFWLSTLAKVTELYRIQILTWARTRDRFVCELASLTLNKMRREQSDKLWQAEDFLDTEYPKRKHSVMITGQDPDRGAQGDWKGMRDNLRGVTDKAKRKMAKRKYHNG
jgi:hypothetical protein